VKVFPKDYKKALQFKESAVKKKVEK
jgi:hypothetical protein